MAGVFENHSFGLQGQYLRERRFHHVALEPVFSDSSALLTIQEAKTLLLFQHCSILCVRCPLEGHSNLCVCSLAFESPHEGGRQLIFFWLRRHTPSLVGILLMMLLLLLLFNKVGTELRAAPGIILDP